MKNITLSITELQHRRLRIWAAERGLSASYIVRRFLEELPKAARGLQAVNAYELEKRGIPPTAENQALVNLLKPIPRNKKPAHLNPEKQTSRKQLAQDQPITRTRVKPQKSTFRCGTVQTTTAPAAQIRAIKLSTSCSAEVNAE